MARRSTIAERGEALVRRMDGAPLCDECITDRLDLSSVSQASVATGAAAGVGGFERLKEPCGLCGEPRHGLCYKGGTLKFAAERSSENGRAAVRGSVGQTG